MLSRLASHRPCKPFIFGIAMRHDQRDASTMVKATGFDVNVTEQMDNPNFFQKLVLRFKGIPLKDEVASPKILFDGFEKKPIFDPLPPVPKDFKEFPERDLVNFPYPERTMYPPKQRFLFFPDHWLKEVEKITGTSGPYLAIVGFLLFAMNKEMIPHASGYIKFIYGLMPMWLVLRYGIAKDKLDKYYYGKWKERMAELKGFIGSELKEANDFRKWSKDQAASLMAAQENFPIILRENLALQLEATYRKNADRAWSELKRRLDYLQEVQETKDRLAKEILLKSITEGVRKRIENNVDGIRDKYMDQCIAQLKTLT